MSYRLSIHLMLCQLFGIELSPKSVEKSGFVSIRDQGTFVYQPIQLSSLRP